MRTIMAYRTITGGKIKRMGAPFTAATSFGGWDVSYLPRLIPKQNGKNKLGIAFFCLFGISRGNLNYIGRP
jgi:hypothetical protein